MNSKFCVDTHSLVWYFLGRKTLSHKAKLLIQAGFTPKATLVIPTLVLLEAFHLSLKQPRFSFPKFVASLKQAHSLVASFDKPTLKNCYKLPPQLNIHDRVIAATALTYHCPLITKDKTLAQQIPVSIIW
ncbi:MAG: PIN domain-containing protein [Candidatus Chisholmbacteria bacterium]|nr:PIN domain-containing protein [Candidatus Chisholmbacteria bacterium]